jgi:serine/threonine-protein kinase PknK
VRTSPGLPSELAFRFRPGERVGRGATSTVYEAFDRQGGRKIALKVGQGVNERTRLADEAELLALADSPGIVAVVDAGLVPKGVLDLEPGLPYIALEWAEGRAIAPCSIANEDRERIALAVARDIGDALASLHAMGVAHGDVKPENVVLATSTPRAILVDLGLGTRADEMAVSGGTLRYLAPECSSPEGGGDARARDLWALGLLLAEIADHSVAESVTPAVRAREVELPNRVLPIARALLSETPAGRPAAEWACRMAREALGDPESRADIVARRHRAVRRAYFAVRGPELAGVASGHGVDIRVSGTPGAWLEARARLLERVAGLRGGVAASERKVLAELEALGRARVLTALVGSAAARWPAVSADTDEALIARLIALSDHRDPRSVTLADLSRIGETDAEPFAPDLLSPPEEAIGLAIALGAAAPSPIVLERAERHVAERGATLTLVLALARALRLAGQPGRALALLDRRHEADAQVESAECARRTGDRGRIGAIAASLSKVALPPVARARFTATIARVELDLGNRDQAEMLLRGVPLSSPVLEVRALVFLSRGRLEEAELDVERGRAVASTDEERARVEAVAGNVAHARGDSGRGLDAFRRAADHASRAGAVLEEATYLTGVAAAGFDAGELGEALEAATRATLLFEHLGRAEDAARALLARAAVYAAAGAVALAREAASEAASRARRAGDVRCRAFCHLIQADVSPLDDKDGLEHARRAATLLGDCGVEDRLRVSARLLRREADVPVPELDRFAEDASIAAPARLEWWGARASVLARDRAPVRADRVLAALSALASVPAPASDRGEALAAAATLAAQTGDGDAARRFAVASVEAAGRLVRGAPPELRASIAALPWVSALRSPRETSIAPEQLADVEALVRALGTRDRLRPLLDQVLDALVLWTGVERGLLLLRAPGGRLAPRAARNIAREDLHGVQLALSRSIAERALATGEPVVAVDAAGELPEVHASVHALKLRSVLAVPLIARGQALGVVYLDDRVRRGAFGPGERAWVRLVATIAAVAIAEARDQLALRRAARRATRAEARLAQVLARREAELDVAERELARTRGDRATRYNYDEILGDSVPVRALLALVDRVTPTEVPVLISGESGSGKELVARAIHRNGPRGKGPFVTENCGAIPESLLESTLFGHVRGAFTGASRPHAGLFEVASGGTLFLDEIGEMSLGMQTKLLRVLEDGEVHAVGSERPRKVDVRVIAATHRDLTKMVAGGTFRNDLFYRLNVICIDVPALRQRPGDVEVLARHFVARHSVGRSTRLTNAAVGTLSAYSWPGNIRQLENEIRRAIVLTDGAIGPEQLSAEVRDGARAEASREDGLNVRRRVDTLEADLVRTALGRTRGNQTRAAELLGLSRFGLQKMIRRLDIAVPSPTALRDDGGAVTGDR